MNPRTWNDQPKALEEAEVILRFHTNGREVEVRRLGEMYYLTAGNLFGSQTLSTVGADNTFRLLNLALNVRDGKTVALPSYAHEVANCEVMDGEGKNG